MEVYANIISRLINIGTLSLIYCVCGKLSHLINFLLIEILMLPSRV
jgi:hypothetical protein